MSEQNKKQSLIYGNFPDPKEPSPQPKGPEKPWPSDMDANAEEMVEFLKDPEAKRALKDFVIDTYKRYEQEKIAQLQARMENEKEVDAIGSVPYHKAGNLSPIMGEELNMRETERAFARGLTATKKNMVRAAEERVEEIQRLLAGIGGFSAQLRSCFARSTVVFLEQEDPKRPFRERITFSINLPNYELKRPWGNQPASGSKKDAKFQNVLGPDGRTTLQATWDDAVNALAQIIASIGLKPKYCKNDRNYGRLVMKQDLRHSSNIPDEYFSFTLDYNTAEKIKDMCEPFNRIVNRYNKQIKALEKKIDRYPADSASSRLHRLKKKYLQTVLERDYFVGTTPDPNQLEEGLLFLIEVSTLKDYHIVKDRMQSLMTKYILHLSQIATNEANSDPDLEYEVWKNKQADGSTTAAPEELESVQAYEVDVSALKPVRATHKKAG